MSVFYHVDLFSSHTEGNSQMCYKPQMYWKTISPSKDKVFISRGIFYNTDSVMSFYETFYYHYSIYNLMPWFVFMSSFVHSWDFL